MQDQHRGAVDLEDLGVRIFKLPAGADSPEGERAYYLHSHPFFELHLVRDGTFRYRCGDRVFPLEEGQFCLFCPGAFHAPEPGDDGALRVCIRLELLRASRPLRDKLAQAAERAVMYTGDGRAMLETAGDLEAELSCPGTFSREMVRSLLSRLMLLLIRALEIPVREPDAPASLDRERSAILDDFFNDRFAEPAGEEALASELGVSRRQLERILRKTCGQSYRQRLTEVRMETACGLLLGTGLTVREISERVGYSSPSSFTVCFRRRKGMTPREYRVANKC